MNLQNILESIQDQKVNAIINMQNAKTPGEKDYFCGIIRGLQLSKQLLEKEALT